MISTKGRGYLFEETGPWVNDDDDDGLGLNQNKKIVSDL